MFEIGDKFKSKKYGLEIKITNILETDGKVNVEYINKKKIEGSREENSLEIYIKEMYFEKVI